MSTSTEAVVGGVVGGVIGYVASGFNPYGAYVGFMLGYSAGSYYDAQKDLASRRREPTLQDKRITAAEYGSPIPIGFGTFKTPGVLIWGIDLYQEYLSASSSGGGKGGGDQKQSTTEEWDTLATFAVKLCKGPIIGIPRVWLDDQLVFDIRKFSIGSVSVLNLESTNETVAAGKDSTNYGLSGGTVQIFTGSETQSPSSIIENYTGVGNAPAYRGDAYLVFHRLRVNKYGKRIPHVTAEVVGLGDILNVVSARIPFSPDVTLTGQLTNYPPNALYAQGAFFSTFDHNNNSGAGGSRLHKIDVRKAVVQYAKTIKDPANYHFYVNWLSDDARGLLWMQTNNMIFAIVARSGEMRVKQVFATALNFGAGLAYLPELDRLWCASYNTIYVMSASKLLNGKTPLQARLQLINSVNASGYRHLVHCPGLKVIVASEFATNDYYVYDYFGNVVTSYTLASADFANSVSTIYSRFDDKIYNWAFQGNPKAGVVRLDVMSGTLETVVSNDLDQTVFAVNDKNGEIVYSQQRVNTSAPHKYKIIANNGDDVSSFQISDVSFGATVGLAWSPDHNAIGVKMGNNGGFYISRLGRIESVTVDVESVIVNAFEGVGVSPSKVSASAVSSSTIGGYLFDGRTEARAAISPLRRIAFFELVMEDGLAKAKKFGDPSVMTVYYDDLVIPDDSDGKRPYTIRRIDEIDLPRAVEAVYSDVDFDFETGVQTASRITRRSSNVAAVTLPAAIDSTTAKKTAEVMLYQAWTGRTTWVLNCSRKHWLLNVGDAFQFVDESGINRRMLCAKREMLGMTRLTVEAVEDAESVYLSSATGVAPAWTTTELSPFTHKQVEILDIPIIKDSDDYLGFYVTADSTAPSASLYESIDGGITYSQIGPIVESNTGYTTTTLGNSLVGNVWDDVNTVTVTLYSGTLESVTDAQVLAGLNAAVIGDEIVQYATATLVTTGTYTLSRLLRGRKGTEWAMAGHLSGERFVPISSALQRISSTATNSPRIYKAARTGATLIDTPPLAFENMQMGKKPYSPVNLVGSRDGSLNLTITWLRRSRLGSAWGPTVDLPLDDAIEKYEVEIMQGAVVKRVITVTTPTATYSAADQTTDFGSTQPSILMNIYQLSSIVGRGTPATATL